MTERWGYSVGVPGHLLDDEDFWTLVFDEPASDYGADIPDYGYGEPLEDPDPYAELTWVNTST